MSEFNTEWWPVGRPIPYARNARKIPERAVDKVAASIKEFGWRQPIVVDSAGVIVAGHARLLGAKKLGLTEVPVHIAGNLTPAQIKAYRLMDNRSHEETSWDDDLLGPELEELRGLDFDLALTGFDERELDRLLTSGEDGADEIQPVPEAAVSQPGDLWLCGSHRILCGDATNAGDVAAVLESQKPALMVTDPPYGVSYDPVWRDGKGGFSDKPVLQRGETANDDKADWSPAWKLFPGDVAYVWHASLYTGVVAGSLTSAGFGVRAQIIWNKQQAQISRGAYHWQHEPCWYVVRVGKTAHWAGDRKQTTVWDIQNLNPTGNRKETRVGHGAQKPIECMRRPIINHGKHRDVIYDPFLGSGTTAIAAEMSGRVCYGLELEPRYVDVSVLRWEGFTGRRATLDGDGRTFEEIKADRAAAVPLTNAAA